jgi:hypothetical protein
LEIEKQDAERVSYDKEVNLRKELSEKDAQVKGLAGQAQDEATARMEAETRAKEAETRASQATAESQAIKAGAIAFVVSIVLIAAFEWTVYGLPWQWLVSHPNSYGLQFSVDGLLVSATLGLAFPKHRKWAWGAGALAFVGVIGQILGGPS